MNPITHIIQLLLTILGVVGAAAFAPAQQSMTEQFDSRFAKQEPLVGETLPDASGFDAEGVPFALASTRGKITVIVSGCLT